MPFLRNFHWRGKAKHFSQKLENVGRQGLPKGPRWKGSSTSGEPVEHYIAIPGPRSTFLRGGGRRGEIFNFRSPEWLFSAI